MLRGAWQMEGGVTSACAITCTPTCKCTCTCARVRARVYVHVHVCTFSCAEGDPGSSSLVTRESKCDKYIWFLVVCSAAQAKGFTGGAVVSQEGLANGRGDTTAASSQQLSSASKPSARSTQQQNPSETIGTSGSETGATSGQRERRHGWDDGSSHLYTRAATSGRILVPRLHAGPRVRNTCLGRCATRLPTRRQSAYYACPLGNPHLPLATGQHRPEPAPASHRPAPASTGQHRPTTSRQPPATSHQPPATSHRTIIGWSTIGTPHYRHPPLEPSPRVHAPQTKAQALAIAPDPAPSGSKGPLGAHAQSLRWPLPAPRTNDATPSPPPCCSSTRNTTQGGVGGSFRVGGFKPPSWLLASTTCGDVASRTSEPGQRACGGT